MKTEAEMERCPHKPEMVPTSQGTPNVAENHHQLGEKHGTNCLPEPVGRTNPAYILISDF